MRGTNGRRTNDGRTNERTHINFLALLHKSPAGKNSCRGVRCYNYQSLYCYPDFCHFVITKLTKPWGGGRNWTDVDYRDYRLWLLIDLSVSKYTISLTGASRQDYRFLVTSWPSNGSNRTSWRYFAWVFAQNKPNYGPEEPEISENGNPGHGSKPHCLQIARRPLKHFECCPSDQDPKFQIVQKRDF